MPTLKPQSDWRNAFTKALVQGDAKVHSIGAMQDGDATVYTFDVESAACNRWYRVEVRESTKAVTTSCDCPAGVAGTRCWHAANCLIRTGNLIEADVAESADLTAHGVSLLLRHRRAS